MVDCTCAASYRSSTFVALHNLQEKQRAFGHKVLFLKLLQSTLAPASQKAGEVTIRCKPEVLDYDVSRGSYFSAHLYAGEAINEQVRQSEATEVQATPQDASVEHLSSLPREELMNLLLVEQVSGVLVLEV